MIDSPVKILVLLILAAAGVSGWFYGWHWKQVAIGSKPTHEEKLIISLQDQLHQLRADNDRLMEELNALGEEDASESPAEPD